MRSPFRLPAAADLRRLSVVALLAANALPLLGVLLLGWDLGQVMLLFWAESVVIGVWHAAKLLDATRGAGRAIVPFFLAHYGMFTLVHGVFVVTIFVRTPTFHETAPGSYTIESEGPWLPALASVLPVVAALFVSHGVSFFHHWRRGGEGARWRERGEAKALMFAAYPRVVVMHVTLLASGFLMLRYGSPVWGLALLVALKTAVDLVSHLAERRRAQKAATSARPAEA